MRRVPLAVVALFLGLVACIGVGAGSKASIREILLSHDNVGETRELSSPISWHFDKDGSFSAVAQTGVPSWSARGTWKEVEGGRVRLRGVSDHASDPKQKGVVFTRTLVAIEIVERRKHTVWAHFTWR